MREPQSTAIDAILGTVVAGRYEIKRRIGSGGMGTVFEAEQVGLGRPVALKMLKRELTTDAETVARFHQEAKATSLLVHPNTVRVFDFGEDDGSLFLAMEYLEGELLTQRIARGTIDVQEAIRIIQGVLRSLSEAHSKGLVHRDLKPDNVYLARIEGNNQAVVKVLDFGIAKTFKPDANINQYETAAGTVFGTPRYMSPEQAQGKTLDPRSDLYSVGVLLYQLIAGRTPFMDEQAVVVMAKHIKEAVPNIRDLAPHQPIPQTMLRTINKALAKDPIERFQTADEFHQALSDSVQDIEVERKRLASSSGTIQSLRPEKKARLPRWAFAAIPLLLIGIGMFSVWLTRLSQAHGNNGIASAGGKVDPPTAEAQPQTGSGTQRAFEQARPPSPVRTPTPENNAAGNALPPPPAAERFNLISDPEAAEVWLEGNLVGRTPFTVQVPPGHEMNIVLKLSGYNDRAVTTVMLRQNQPIELERDSRHQRRRTRRGYGRIDSAGPRSGGYARF